MAAKFQYGDPVSFTAFGSNYTEGMTGHVINVVEKDGKFFYTVRDTSFVGGFQKIENVPEDHLKHIKGDKLERVEEILREKQKTKEFKDTDIRIRGSKKEARALDRIGSVDLEDIEQDEITAIKMIVKDKVYPPIDIEEEKAKGTSAGAAYLKKSLRDAMAGKPNENSKIKRKIYVIFIERLIKDLADLKTVKQVEDYMRSISDWTNRDLAMLVIADFNIDLENPATKEKFETALANLNKKYYGQRMARQVLTELFGKRFSNFVFLSSDSALLDLKQAKLYEAVSPEQEAENLIKWREGRQRLIDANEKIIAEYKAYDTDSLRRKMFDWTRTDPEWKKEPEKFRTWAIAYYQRRVDEAKSTIDKLPDHLKQRQDDWSWTEKAVRTGEKKKTTLIINQGIPLNYIKRTGGLKISDVSTQSVLSTFGFKAVEFGQSLKDSEAKEHVRHFLGSMSDLSEILNIDLKALNKLGGLSIAFGSRGSGRASAHYQPGRVIINITRSRGDGFLSHEWSHYLDNALTMIGREGISLDFGSNSATDVHHKIANPKVNEKMRAIIDFFHNGFNLTPTIKKHFLAVPGERIPQYYSKDRINKNVEILGTIEETLNNLQEDYPSISSIDYKYPSLQASIYGYIIYKHGFEEYEVPVKLKTSAYYHYSSLVGSHYWIKPEELFARAWETFTYDLLHRSGRANNYLVSGEMFDLPQKVYPFGAERDHVFNLYSDLIKTIKQEYSLPDFVPFTTERTDEYIDLKDDKEEKVEAGIIADHETKKVEEVIHGDEVIKHEPDDALALAQAQELELLELELNLSQKDPMQELIAENNTDLLSLGVDDTTTLTDKEGIHYYVKRISKNKFVIEKEGTLGKENPSELTLSEKQIREMSIS